jgi:hypothetical protein
MKALLIRRTFDTERRRARFSVARGTCSASVMRNTFQEFELR